MPKRTALFFGSFNPVHVGHLIIAEFIRSLEEVDEVWMVVSPHNPFKNKSTLANNYDRLEMVRLAIGDNYKIRGSDIEFNLPQPSYTIDTLQYLEEKYPDRDFALIMGGDNLVHFDKWKNYEMILERYDIYVYARPDYTFDEKYSVHPRIHIQKAPLLSISASYIRERIRRGESARYFVPDDVYEFIQSKGLYSKVKSRE